MKPFNPHLILSLLAFAIASTADAAPRQVENFHAGKQVYLDFDDVMAMPTVHVSGTIRIGA